MASLHMLGGDVSYPGSAITEDNPRSTPKKSRRSLSREDPPGKDRKLLVGITGGDGFNGALQVTDPPSADRFAFPGAAVG